MGFGERDECGPPVIFDRGWLWRGFGGCDEDSSIQRMIEEKERSMNLLDLVTRDTRLRRMASTHGGEYAGPCPFCGGRDRFRVWPNMAHPRYWCRVCRK